MLRYKIDVLQELKNHGFNTTRLRQEKIIPESTLTRIRKGDTGITLESLNTICCICRLQPGDVIECQISDAEKVKYF